MTRNTFEYDLQGGQVKLKRYFYALRPALACRWILEKKSVPPMEFHHLRALVTDVAWQDAVDDLLKRKMAAEEKAFIAPVAFLQQWLAHVALPSSDTDLKGVFVLPRQEMYGLTYTPPESIRYRHPLMELINPEDFLSKLCMDTFAGYAKTQIKKARGLNKKINRSFERERKSVLDFCLRPHSQ